MDFRDILKSFDNLSEGDSTVHKAGPGGYGNKHGSEDVTDQYGKPIGRMSLGKLASANEPKRGKGRPPNPDKAKEYDSTALNKAMGIGKAPKPTGKPSVKHSLKEYFDQMDEALSEAGLAVQPMPATPQQKQQQAVATKPSFMIKDPANPNMPAITTQDPAVVQAAKNGTMSMQKPGAAPTAPGATPAAGAGSQVGAMAEDELDEMWGNPYDDDKVDAINAANPPKAPSGQPNRMTPKPATHVASAPRQANTLDHDAWDKFTGRDKAMAEDDKNWIKGAIKHPGAFTKKAKSHGMTPSQFRDKVLAHKEDYPAKTEKQATLAKTLGKMHNEADMEEGWKGAAIGGALGSLAGPAGAFAGAAAGHFVGNDMAKWGKDKQVAKTAQAQQQAKQGVKEADAPQHFAQSSPLSTANRGVLEGKKGVNPFAKKDTKKKPDADKDGVPDWADKKPGKDDNEGKKKGAAPKKGVNPFAKKDEKKKVKESMEHNLQAARLQGKSHALRKMPYNCTHDDMEEARHYHEGFKEGLDECYGQMPILGRTAVGEMGSGPEVDTMASYGADDMGMDEGNAFTAGLARTPQGSKFKVGGNTFTDRTHYDSNLDEFAFESLDKQLNSLLESEEKVSEGMTVSISKGQQGSPDSVSVSAQDGEADQLLSIIKSAGMGLFGGDEQNGYGAPQGSTQAPGGIEVVDDHDGMMALMKKLSGGGDMQGGGDYEDEEGSGEEGHMHGEEGHSHEGGEESVCSECGGMWEDNHQCGSGQEQVVDEVESEDQMTDEVAENAPDSGAAETAADDASEAGEDAALATDDAAQDEEEGQTYSSPTNEAEDDEEEDDKKDFFHNPNVPADKQLKAPPKEVNVAESFANLYKKLAFLSEESIDKEEDEKAEKAGKKVTKDIEYDDKKDKKKIDEWANEAGKNGTDAAFEADIDFMTKVISGGLNKQKSTGQTTVPVVSGQSSRMGVDGLGSPMKESTDLLKDYMKLSGL